MDKKKLLIGTLCILIVIMAVGYALLAQQLKINGKTVGFIEKNSKFIGSYDDDKIINNKNEDILFSPSDYLGRHINPNKYNNKNKYVSESTYKNALKPEKKLLWADNNTENDPTGENVPDDEENITYIQDYIREYFKNAIASTEIKGTIYSNGNINIQGKRASFYILGALIANKNITIKNISSTTLKYDPDYVPFFDNYGIFTNLVFQSVF